ncbi:M42 family metallopeptidase [Longimicrobium terrae]|uniref:Endoglucanase n=1 Tax=Longimicrobium terrae TaxID=1639882 RepID=A0A841GWR5_9BACT|nr:M42 family metallopeptidase [Longimicrobium terrae]MBB4635322.1 endoglucanase [Longimicrobium terrae]MBB6069715.1 endoglucanase [Longimicrobium terrae]NNC31074.1 M42 family metallopeptidase [Longimicrobium terrae]
MEDSSFEFLKKLLDAPGPSGFETAAARVWRAEAETFAQNVRADVGGNSLASVGPQGGPRIMLAGHVDEIGVMITHIDEEGFLYVDGIGGWDPQVLVGQRIRFLSRGGDIMGVVGKKPIHLIKPEEKEKAVKLSDLWVDIGVADHDGALRRGVRVGDPGIVDTRLVELGSGLIASRAVDNRVGAFVVLEVLRELSRDGCAAEVTAVATAQEEIGYQGGGARTSAFTLDPAVAVVVDLTFATDAPGVDKKQVGEHKLGSGPVLSRGSAIHPLMFERFAETAEKANIPYTIQGSPRFTSTDADAIYLQRGGVPTAVVSVPNRYMHSPNEVVSLDDIDATIKLIAAFCRTIQADDDFVPR